MCADDTTLYAIAPTQDLVAEILNRILSKFYLWCCHNQLTPHPDKTEHMIMSRRKFVGPLQCLKLGDGVIKRIESTS
jgi:hypothetical protein